MSGAGPIIVTGPDRSGTTLLYALLASHPDISMVRRTNLWRWFDGRYGDLSLPENLDRCLTALLSYHRIHVLEPDERSIRDELARGPATYGRLFAIMHRQHAARHGKRRWGDKSLHTEYRADRILAELPDARIVQLVRDPRDRHASIVSRYVERDKGVAATTGMWISSVRQGRRNVERHPGRCAVVRYESLASRPEQTLRDVCDFLDERFDPAMLRMEALSADGDRSGNSSFEPLDPGVISTRSIGRYRSILSVRDLAFIQMVARRPMATHGYAIDPLQMSLRQTLGFYGLVVPPTMVRLAGWSASHRIERRRGSGVPAHRLAPPAPERAAT